MRYLTKEWHKDWDISNSYEYIQENVLVAEKDENIYNLFYRQQKKKHTAFNMAWFNEDMETAEKQFDYDLKCTIELYEKLPEHILKYVADIRVLALGYATKKVKRLLKVYCDKVKKESGCEEKYKLVKEQNKKFPCHLNAYISLKGIEKAGGDIFLEFNFGDKIQIKNARLTEGEGYTLNSGGRNLVHAIELYENEVCLLLENNAEDCGDETRYLTVVGTELKFINITG